MNKLRLAVKTVLNEIENSIEDKKKLSNASLIKICRENGNELVETAGNAHLIHEIVETAINLHIEKTLNRAAVRDKPAQTIEYIDALTQIIPTQSWRSDEQRKLQQFSTPPAIAFLMTLILNPTENDFAVEPSAGTGCLAAWLRIAGCRVHVNELSETRRALLELQGYQPTKVNSEFLNDLLPSEIKPDCVLMNPPFSSSAGRVKRNDSNFGFRHVSSALARLNDGGKLVVLLGTKAALKSDKGKRFWRDVAQEHTLKAFINLPGKAYYKFGTSINTTIVAIEKRGAERQSPLIADCAAISEAFSLSRKVFASN